MTKPTSSEEHSVRLEVRKYLVVFVSLIFLTFLVVTVSSLHLNKVVSALLLLFIAGVKASLVACYFMHLMSEKSTIVSLLILTVIFLVVLLLLPTFQLFNAV